MNAMTKLIGATGSHYDLARQLENEGFLVIADPDDNERSIVKVNREGREIDLAEIIGDSEAVVKSL